MYIGTAFMAENTSMSKKINYQNKNFYEMDPWRKSKFSQNKKTQSINSQILLEYS